MDVNSEFATLTSVVYRTCSSVLKSYRLNFIHDANEHPV